MVERENGGRFKKGTSANPGGRPRVVGDVRELAMEQTPASIRTLVEIRDNPNSPAQARVAAANAILDRALGKPVQSVTGDGAGAMVVRVVKFADLEADEEIVASH